MEYEIKDVCIEDAKELLSIYAPYVLKTAITFDYEVPSLEDFSKKIEDTIKTYPYIKAVSLSDGRILGYSYVSRFRARKAYDYSVETSIYLREDVRGNGIGRALYTEMENRLRSMGILNMNASITEAKGEDPYLDPSSMLFHEKMGYRKVGTFHNSGFKFGRWYDMTFMEKMLGPHETTPPSERAELGTINGMNFAVFPRRGTFEKEETYRAADTMIERLGVNFVILTPSGLQDTPQSETITWDNTVSDEELIRMIDYLHSKSVQVAIKPTVNCKNGTWRGHIAFFEDDVICEPKWRNWFKAYSEFQCHFAKIAEKTGCEMFIAGCEMVQTDHRDKEWRGVIRDIRKVYNGIVSYNCDKYQEDHITWWDAVDVISSSGYYPIDSWDKELRRIKTVADNFNKPFFFAETGCMSVEGSEEVPNNWGLPGGISEEVQAAWYEKMLSAVRASGFVKGTGLWSFTPSLYTEEEAHKRGDYDIYLKTAEKVVAKYYK